MTSTGGNVSVILWTWLFLVMFHSNPSFLRQTQVIGCGHEKRNVPSVEAITRHGYHLLNETMNIVSCLLFGKERLIGSLINIWTCILMTSFVCVFMCLWDNLVCKFSFNNPQKKNLRDHTSHDGKSNGEDHINVIPNLFQDGSVHKEHNIWYSLMQLQSNIRQLHGADDFKCVTRVGISGQHLGTVALNYIILYRGFVPEAVRKVKQKRISIIFYDCFSYLACWVNSINVTSHNIKIAAWVKVIFTWIFFFFITMNHKVCVPFPAG